MRQDIQDISVNRNPVVPPLSPPEWWLPDQRELEQKWS